ncbi:MAG: DnaG primase-like protein, partial [uncultured bacterium]
HSLEGLAVKEQLETIKRIHRNAQRLLKPVKVIIPYVELIDFPTEWIRTRRDHDRFLNLIVSVAFLHQYQREIKEFKVESSKLKVEYIEANIKDYAIAYRIAKTVLFNTFQELEKPVFDFYLKLLEMVEAEAKKQGVAPEEFTFTRRNIRQVIKLPDYLVKRFMRVLKDLEYFEVKNHGNGSKDVYQLIVHTKKTDFLFGLTTPSQLKAKMDK